MILKNFQHSHCLLRVGVKSIRCRVRQHQKGSIKIKNKKSLILRIHDIIEPLPDLVARPANRPSVPRACELDQLLSGVLQILKKKCILYNYRVKSAQNGKFLIPEDFHTASICN